MSRNGHALSRTRMAGPDRAEERRPDDLYVRLRERSTWRGEVRLALAVLEDAARRIETSRRSRRFLPRSFAVEAESWMESQDRSRLFAFENVCSLLELDADEVRGRLLGRRGRRRSRIRRTSAIPGRGELPRPFILPSLWA